MGSPPPVEVVAALALVLAASVCDVLTRRIPNVLTFGAIVVALAMHGMLRGWSGLLFAASGGVVGFLLFFPVFALKGLGAGDVKLLAAVGAWLGPASALWTALYGAVAGGVLAIVIILARGLLGRTLQNIWMMFRTWFSVGLGPVDGMTLDGGTSPRLPYALPVAVGTLITLWVR